MDPAEASRLPGALPLFPLRTVLFPGGLMPLRVFEQRYIEMTKTCVRDGRAFGVCLLTRGNEVMREGGADLAAVRFATIGTTATITDWDTRDGVLHLRTVGGTRFRIESHAMEQDGRFVGTVRPLPPEASMALSPAHAPLARLLEALATKLGPTQFPDRHAFDDVSWVGYRLAELLPLPLEIKQNMLEINDGEIRLAVLARFLDQHGLI